MFRYHPDERDTIGWRRSLRSNTRHFLATKWHPDTHRRKERQSTDWPTWSRAHGRISLPPFTTPPHAPLVFQPRSLELFTTIRVIDEVMKCVIPVPRVRKYQLSEGIETIQEFDMYPPQNPTPSAPYVRPQYQPDRSQDKDSSLWYDKS